MSQIAPTIRIRFKKNSLSALPLSRPLRIDIESSGFIPAKHSDNNEYATSTVAWAAHQSSSSLLECPLKPKALI